MYAIMNTELLARSLCSNSDLHLASIVLFLCSKCQHCRRQSKDVQISHRYRCRYKDYFDDRSLSSTAIPAFDKNPP